jgi:hypothetical protein
MSTTTKQKGLLDEFDVSNEAFALEATTTFPLSEPTREARGRMGRYARIQTRDFFMRQGTIMSLTALALLVPLLLGARQTPEPFVLFFTKMFEVISNALIGVGMLVSTRGIVSDDTQHGFHRFLFSKPLSIERYYAQLFGVRFAGYMAMLLLLLAPFMLFGSVPLFGALAMGACVFTLLGGIGFLLSTITRLDTGVLLALSAASLAVQGMSREPYFAFLKPLAVVLPPVYQLGELAQWFALGGRFAISFPLGSLLWVLGYGVSAFVAGLAVLRRRAVPA